MQQQHKFKMTVDNGDGAGVEDDDGGFANLVAGRTRRQMRQFGGPENYRTLTCDVQSSRRPMQLANKDLIIRMLAEIFQVRQDESGQIRWQQMSSSLVPISLYSRTTSKWLDYLLAASTSMQATDPASAMSPDSRDFLLLLQQFHHHQTATAAIQVDQQQQQQQQQQNESIVFQVVGHDFIEGQCRKVLNVKIRQPGTRLGQASDYFVYWREQQPAASSSLGHRLHHQQFSASSFASSCSQLAAGTQVKTTQMLNHPASTISRHNSRLAADEQQTWGLNFASINDAKLFYDICSLNLVDLDFNSEYLKQLSDTQYRQQVASTMSHRIPMATNSPFYPTPNRNSSRLKQQQQQLMKQQQQRLLSRQQQSQRAGKMSSRGQSSISRCEACRQSQEQKQLSAANEGGYCPIHGGDTLRVRSRSTTRQSSKPARENADDNFKRSRSFSTPASPTQLDQCPVHGRRHRANTECEHQAAAEDTRRKQQAAYKRQQRRLAEQQELEWSNKMLASNSRELVPQKPARGFLRMMPSRDSQENFAPLSQKRQKVPQSHLASESSRLMGNTMGYAHESSAAAPTNCNKNMQPGQLTFDTFNKSTTLDNFIAGGANFQQTSRTLQSSRRQLMQQNSAAANRSSLQRAQVGAETFDTIARRDARLARARYANSKNMKEFLSLDAGGFGQSTPMQQQQRFKRQQTKQQQQKLTDNKQSIGGSTGLVNGSKQKEQQRHLVANSSASNDREQTGSKQSIQMSTATNSSSAAGATLDRAHSRLAPEEAQAAKGHELANDIRCTVSTTTDDLPMDSSTRRRMLKLTSEEVISERTEPKSACSTSTALERTSQEVGGEPLATLAASADGEPRDERLDRKVRAVSLGPDFVGGRGRGARSDASRRRSLERSMCVDLDSSLPASSFSKSARLSPLVQSGASPQETGAVGERSSKNSPSFPGFLEAPEQEPGEEFMSDGLCGEPAPIAPATPAGNMIEAAGDKISGRPYASQVPQLHYQLHHQLAELDDNGALSDGRAHVGRFHAQTPQFGGNFYQHQHQQQRSRRGVSTFKSAPDIRAEQLGGNMMMDVGLANEGYNQPLLTDDDNNVNFELVTGGSAATSGQSSERFAREPPISLIVGAKTSRGRSNLSSYAVPLCTTVKRPPQQQHQQQQTPRQCQSCPSSLRRKRRLLAARNVPSNIADQLRGADWSAWETLAPARRQPYCSCLNCRQVNMMPHCALSQNSWMPAMASNGCGCMCAGQMSGPCFNCELAYSSLQSSGSQARHCRPMREQHQIQQHQPLYCHHHLGPFHSSYNRQAPQSNAYQQQQPQQPQLNYSFRSHSSQSNRSTVHYGLYESECDDDQDENDDDNNDDDDDDDGEPNAGNGDDETLLAGDNVSARQLDGGQDCFSRSHSAHFRPTIMRPVQGYDQTLARATLKSRQRSRSQPPASSAEAKNSFHLTKSMENVEKLIKEVQNELRALKRQPLGTAQIDLSSAPATIAEANRRRAITTAPKFLVSSSGIASGQYGNRTAVKMSVEENEAQEQQQQQADSKLSYSSATRRAGQFKCVGAIRKAGFLSVKKWIIKRRQSIELARKQGWKRYWVCLRGTALLFHSVVENRDAGQEAGAEEEREQQTIDLLTWIQSNCSSQVNLVTNLLQHEQQTAPDSRDAFLKSMAHCYIEREPRHLIIIDGSIAQPIPEHPRRDFVFCLSTTFGDAYLFQASCQLESDNWISAIHNACAGSIARDLTRDEAIKLFETKIRHFELEAEKKIFLRQRLESRLTSMSSICGHTWSRLGESGGGGVAVDSDRYANASEDKSSKLTMRNLLQQLNQQLLALDTYIEQLHCEVYQLRCYLCSCGAQNLFYQNVQQQQQQQQRQENSGGVSQKSSSVTTSGVVFPSNELPHPKSLLMHVSKPTKLLLIKLGIFTVSSFHALIHARQDSAKSILHQIECNTNNNNNDPTEAQNCAMSSSSPLELRIRSHSISETLLLSKTENARLENDTEDLLEIANLKRVSVRVAKSLATKIRQQNVDDSQVVQLMSFELSDDRCSIEDSGNFIWLNLKVNPNATSSSIVRQALKVLQPNTLGGQFEFLNYYLRLVLEEDDDEHQKQKPSEVNSRLDVNTNCAGGDNFYVIKRKETVNDWTNYSHIELIEKMIFRVELTRSRTDEVEASTPFGISVEGQLFSGKSESLLNVYCNYIEWGSAADKAGLQDEDELLMMNGIPVGELDLMFVECIIQEANKLRAVVRSTRLDCPKKGRRLDMTTWRSLDDDADRHDDDDGDDDDDRATRHKNRNILRDITNQNATMSRLFESAGSQVISDEYLTSLVCPPPPGKSSAALLQADDSPMLRQKSDLGIDRSSSSSAHRFGLSMSKSRSQHQIDVTLESEPVDSTRDTRLCDVETEKDAATGGNVASNAADLAKQLIQKTERLSRLLGRADLDRLSLNAHLSSSSVGSRAEQSEQHCERLRKSLLELIETEYAYIRHLETICEHYMSPLEENEFLNIADLRGFNQIVLDILCFQHDFFHRLTSGIASACELGTKQLMASADEFERLNRIVQLTDTLNNWTDFKPIVDSIARLFESEADRFKLYGSYCVAYSKLQRILHPKRPTSSGKNARGSSISSIPSALNTFSTSAHSNSLASLGPFHQHQHAQHRADSRLVSLMHEPTHAAATDQGALLKQLSEFLGNLDSSSSSASLSLAGKSSGAEQVVQQASKTDVNVKVKAMAANAANGTAGQGSVSISSGSTQKNVHQQNFESYLIKPIQRLVKYPMLLNSIALAALEAHENRDSLAEQTRLSLQAAISQMELVINHVNDVQRVHDEYGTIFERIESQFFAQQASESGKHSNLASLFGAHQAPISLNLAQLLHWGPVAWLNVAEFSSKVKKQQMLSSVTFVFASCVVFICKEPLKAATSKRAKTQLKQDTKACMNQENAGSRSLALGSIGCESATNEVVRYQTLIPVSEVQVRAVAQERQLNPSAGFEWELFQCSSSSSNSGLLCKSSTGKRDSSSRSAANKAGAGRRYLLSSESNEQRNVFLRKIRFTIRESVKNMSLPLGRSPSSKSFELKKLSTSSATSVNSNTNVHSSLSQANSLSPAEQDEARDRSLVAAVGKETANACDAFGAPKAERAFESAIRVNS